MTKKQLAFVFETLKKTYPAKTELVYHTPFQLVVAVMLSAQTTDKQVNKVTEKFFANVKKPEDIVKLWLAKLTRLVHSVNYYKTKAKHIFALSKILVKNWWKIPETVVDLMVLPGIWEKTAKVIAHVLYGLDVIPVDTHVHRIANRLGRVHTKTPLETSQLLEKVVPKEYKSFAHHVLVLFGRYFCTARKPQCEQCPFKKFCEYYKKSF